MKTCCLLRSLRWRIACEIQFAKLRRTPVPASIPTWPWGVAKQPSALGCNQTLLTRPKKISLVMKPMSSWPLPQMRISLKDWGWSTSQKFELNWIEWTTVLAKSTKIWTHLPLTILVNRTFLKPVMCVWVQLMKPWKKYLLVMNAWARLATKKLSWEVILTSKKANSAGSSKQC